MPTTEELFGVKPSLSTEDLFGGSADNQLSTEQSPFAQDGEQPEQLESKPEANQIEFKEAFAREFTGTEALKKIPIIGAGLGMAENVVLADAAKRLKNPDFDYETFNIAKHREHNQPEFMPGVGYVPKAGKSHVFSKEQDAKRVDDFLSKLAEEQERGFSFGGRVAQGLAIMPTWMAEFALTGGLASVGSKATKEVVFGIIKNQVRTKAGRLALKTAGWTGGAITRASLGLTVRIGEDATRRQLEGEVGIRDKEGWATSIVKAWGGQVIEAASEEAGGAITKGLGKLVPKKLLSNKFITGVQKVWSKTTGGKSGEFYKKLITKGGYSNIIGEVGEERLGQLLRDLTGVSDTEGNVAQRVWQGLKEGFDPDNLAVEATVLLVPMGGQVLTSTLGGRKGAPVEAEKPNLLTPEVARTYIQEHPRLSQRIASLENPSRKDLKDVGITTLNAKERRQFAGLLKRQFTRNTLGKIYTAESLDEREAWQIEQIKKGGDVDMAKAPPLVTVEVDRASDISVDEEIEASGALEAPKQEEAPEAAQEQETEQTEGPVAKRIAEIGDEIIALRDPETGVISKDKGSKFKELTKERAGLSEALASEKAGGRIDTEGKIVADNGASDASELVSIRSTLNKADVSHDMFSKMLDKMIADGKTDAEINRSLQQMFPNLKMQGHQRDLIVRYTHNYRAGTETRKFGDVLKKPATEQEIVPEREATKEDEFQAALAEQAAEDEAEAAEIAAQKAVVPAPEPSPVAPVVKAKKKGKKAPKKAVVAEPAAKAPQGKVEGAVKKSLQMTTKEFIKDTEFGSRPNKIDEPSPNQYKDGDLMIDTYGEDPYVYELQHIDPHSVDVGLEGMTKEEAIKMPTTQKYIEWAKQGIEPPPITILSNVTTGKQTATNRRRVIAAREAGVKMPAFVEIGRRKEMIRAALAKGESVPAEVLAEHPEIAQPQSKSKGKPVAKTAKAEKQPSTAKLNEGLGGKVTGSIESVDESVVDAAEWLVSQNVSQITIRNTLTRHKTKYAKLAQDKLRALGWKQWDRDKSVWVNPANKSAPKAEKIAGKKADVPSVETVPESAKKPAPVVAKKKGKIVRDTDLTTVEEIRERRASISKQVEKLEAVRNPKDFDKHHEKIKKLHERRHTLAAGLRQIQKATAEKEAEPIAKETVNEQETITEPTPSPEVEQGEAGDVVPTGKLDPTNPKEALEITEYHANWLANNEGRSYWTGIFSAGGKGKVGIEIEYTPEQVDAAYRTVQKSIESPMPNMELFAMPGKEAALRAIAEKAKKIKGQKQKDKTAKLTKPKPLPRAKTKQADHIKAVTVASAAETTRYAISGVFIEGDNLVATDGRRLVVAKGKWGKDGVYTDKASLKKGNLGKIDPEAGNFPKWQDIVPEVSKRDAIVIDDLNMLWRQVKQAALLTTEETKGVVILANKDGTLGFASASPEVGHAEINVQAGAKILGGINPHFLLDSIALHATRGDISIEVYFAKSDRPMMTKSPDGKTFTVIMPVNTESAKEIKERISGGFGSRNTGVTQEEIDKLRAEEKTEGPLRGKRAKGFKKGSARVFTPKDFIRAGKFAAYYFEGGIREIQALTAKMVETMGESVRPHMAKLFADAKKTVEGLEKPASKAKVTPKVTKATPKVTPKPLPQAKGKVKSTSKRKESKSVFAKQMQDDLRSEGVRFDIEYDEVHIEDQVTRAQKLINEHPEEAARIALGGENSTGIKDSVIIGGLYLQAKADGNLILAKKYADRAFAYNVNLGQEVAVIKGLIEDNSPLKWYRTLKSNLVERASKKFGVGKEGSTAKDVMKKLKKSVKVAEGKLTKVQMNHKTGLDYLESLRC